MIIAVRAQICKDGSAEYFHLAIRLRVLRVVYVQS